MDKIWDITIRTTTDNNKIKRVLGRYWINKQIIELFPTQFNNNLMAYKDTVLHELAHHITTVLYSNANSHGREWKQVCRVIGADPSATKDFKEWNRKWQQSKNIGYFTQYIL